jgi:aminoglycoside phosphotransferase family enzyme
MANAQNCTLDIGGKNTETIIDVFQLNEAQIATMETLRGELAVETKSVEDQIEKLLAEHPQSTEEDLIKLADKYKVLQQKIVNASYESDKKLLSQFNPKQYERYLQLCKAAIRRPIAVIPKIYNDTIEPE